MCTPASHALSHEADGRLDVHDLPEALAPAVVEGLLGDVRSLEAEVRQLQQALATRAPIEQAKGVLMLRYGVDADTAFRVLVRWSSISNVKLREVARTVVAVAGEGHDPSDRHPAVLAMLDELADVVGTQHRRLPSARPHPARFRRP